MKSAALIVMLGLTAAPAVAVGKPAKRTANPAHKAQAAAPPVAERSAGDASTNAPAPATATAPATPSASNGGAKVKTKTYTFGAMDVEGKLKTPQLLYFLNRVKLELDMSAPDKRSFMKELERSADDKSL